MHFKQKIMNEASENWKKIFGLDFDPFDQNLAPKYFFCGFYLCQMLDIVASYHRIQFQEKLVIQTLENGKKPHFTLLHMIQARWVQIRVTKIIL